MAGSIESSVESSESRVQNLSSWRLGHASKIHCWTTVSQAWWPVVRTMLQPAEMKEVTVQRRCGAPFPCLWVEWGRVNRRNRV
jgi:hypothetical protein